MKKGARQDPHNNYRIMVNNIDSTAHKKLQRILILKLILAANVCPNMDERLTGIELIDKMKKITGLMKQIVGADEAFFSIRKSIDKKASKELFRIAATDRTDLPFVLNTHFFTRKVFYRKDSYTYYHKKLDRNFLEEIYFKNFNSIIVMRFFKPDTDIPAGAVTFMFKHEPLEIRENIKYLLLVEQDIKLLLRKHFFNDSFKSYINDRDLYDYTDILSHWFHSNIIARPKLIIHRGYLERKLSEITNFLSNRKIQSFTNKTNIEVGVIWGVIEDYIGEKKKELTENEKERIKLSQNPLPDSRETFSIYIDKNFSALKHPLQNIVNNSIDHNRDIWDTCEKNHQHLEIKIEVRLEGNELAIAISDNGEGFKESEVREFNDMKPWIFTRKYTGIYIIKSLIYLCNGTVTFDNKDPKGSKITIRYPIYKEVKR